MNFYQKAQRVTRLAAIIVVHEKLVKEIDDALEQGDLWEVPQGHPARRYLNRLRTRHLYIIRKVRQYVRKMYVEKAYGTD
ncbi:hypothetical protein AB6J89_004703 [Salmonella enterica]